MSLKSINFILILGFAILAGLLLVFPIRPVEGAGYQPDLMIRLASEDDAQYFGAGTFESEPRSQFKFQSVPTATAASFRVLVKNAGDLPDTFLFRGSPSGSGFSVRYLSETGSDLSAAVAAEGVSTVRLAPGESAWYRVEVTPAELPLGTSYQVTVGAFSSADAARGDRAALVTVTCGATAAVTLSAPPDGSASPGGSASYPYTLTNVGTGSNTFTLASATSGGSSALLSLDGRPTSSTGPLAPGESYRFSAVVTLAPESVNGSTALTTVTAAGTGADATDRVGTTTVAPVITVSESVRNLTRGGPFADSAEAVPGETLEYRMAVTNSGSAPAPVFSLRTAVPENTRLTAGSIMVAASALGEGEPCSPSVCGSAGDSGGEIGAYLGEGATPGTGGSLAPGKSYYVFFRVVLQ